LILASATAYRVRAVTVRIAVFEVIIFICEFKKNVLGFFEVTLWSLLFFLIFVYIGIITISSCFYTFHQFDFSHSLVTIRSAAIHEVFSKYFDIWSNVM